MTDYDSELAPFQDQDLRLLKALVSDQRLALDFVNSNNSELFLGQSKQVGKVICDYVKSYKSIPTQRILSDLCKDNDTLTSQIDTLFEMLPLVSFDANEYQYDLEKIKQRYVDTRYRNLKDDLQFGKMSSEQAIQNMDSALKDIKRIKQPSRSVYVQKGLDDFLPEFKKKYVAKIENPELGQGVLTGYSYLDYVTNGLAPGELMIIGAQTSGGKAVPIDTIIPTPSGMKEMKDIHPGDQVFGMDGKPYTVLAESEVFQGIGYKFFFDDGSEIVSHDNHLWFTLDSKETVGSVKTTLEIVETLSNNHAIPIPGVLALPKQNLKVHSFNIGYSSSRETYIDEEYFWSSLEQRFELFIGFTHTRLIQRGGKDHVFDGNIFPNKRLANQVLFLARSLGYKAKLVENDKSNWVVKINDEKFKYILRAEKTPSTSMKCIQVSSPDNLYLCGDGLTPTHNSMLLNNMAIQMWMQKNTIFTDPADYTSGRNILYFSLEMPYEPCFRRTLARLADVPIYGLRDSKLTRSETESINLASKFIMKFSPKARFEIVDIPRGVTVEQIEERYLEARTRFSPDVIVVDYLGLLKDPTFDGDDWLELGEIAGKLHELGRVYNVGTMTAVQLNRPTKSKNADPADLINIDRIGRSSLILHHANIGIQIETRKDEHTRDTMVYHIIKNRDGELGKHEIRKKLANASILDLPYSPPDRDEFGSFISGFNDEEDISGQVRKILGL